MNSNALIGVGAVVSPEIMIAEDSHHLNLPGTSTTVTSRGSCPAVITSVPQFLLWNIMLMNGTSMASSHVVGVVALLLSGMVQQNVPYTPHSPKRPPENSAQPIETHDGQDRGLVKVETKNRGLMAYHNQPD